MTAFFTGLLALLLAIDIATRLFPIRRPGGSVNSSTGPTVVVNMPADAKPLATLTEPGEKVVGEDRAVLWWTVYGTTLENPDIESPEINAVTARKAADAAVDKVYGPAPQGDA